VEVRVTEADVLKALEALDSYAPRVWIDGGWGVDALVEEQTRDHTDLDLAVNQDDLPAIQDALAKIGYRHDVSATPGLPARLVLRDDEQRQIDIHPLRFDREGNGWQQLSETGRAWGRYPAEHLQAVGRIGDQQVRCLSPELQFRYRLAHEWSSSDEHDIRMLASRFDVGSLPPPLWGRA
jgi:lincosamide nucleotidyltransferase A/C/D/E